MTDYLSVIIPNYGDADLLPRALKSVERAAPGAEVVVVTNERLRRTELPQENIKLQVVRTDPQPAGHNRNVGLDRATRKYVTFCDADDELARWGVKPRVEALESGFDIAVGDPIYVDGGEERRERLGDPTPDAATAYLREKWVPVIGCMLCHRSVFENNHFWEGIHRAQDFHLWATLFAEYDVTTVDVGSYKYHQHDEQRSRKGLPSRYACQAAGAAAVAFSHPQYIRPCARRGARAAWIAMKQTV